MEMRVGTGAYGAVFKARHRDSREVFACKVCDKTTDPILGGFPLSVLREIEILKRCCHPNIVKLVEVVATNKGDPIIVMELCQSSLQELLQDDDCHLSFSEVKYLVQQIIDATAHIHQRGVLHRDLATKNILFNTEGTIKVCDFGISRVAFGELDTSPVLGHQSSDLPPQLCVAPALEPPNAIVTLPYRAIELLLGQTSYGPELDVWSIGCIFGEILRSQKTSLSSGIVDVYRCKPFFGGEPDAPNKTPELAIKQIFEIVGAPTPKSWPDVVNLPVFRRMQQAQGGIWVGPSGKKARENRERARDASFAATMDNLKAAVLRMQGGGGVDPGSRIVSGGRYMLTDNCFAVLASLLMLNPGHRARADQILHHDFFTKESPRPEWHPKAWTNKVVAKGRRKRAAEEAARKATKPGTNPAGARVPEGKAGQPPSSRTGNQDDAQLNLPKGWTREWSRSKMQYYYHNHATKKNQWEPPKPESKK
mmetsp:Transcript_17771/g.39143  ORF Transcript_17771/g.39143 Transcript_17771/m.39143 type:complete len:479 (-) Transcript_17771:49-1485(-)